MSAHFDNVMFASLQPSDFLRSVCLHCREMSMIHMHPLKAVGLSFNFGNVIQVIVVPWISRVYGICTLSVVMCILEGKARGNTYNYTKGTNHTP